MVQKTPPILILEKCHNGALVNTKMTFCQNRHEAPLWHLSFFLKPHHDDVSLKQTWSTFMTFLLLEPQWQEKPKGIFAKCSGGRKTDLQQLLLLKLPENVYHLHRSSVRVTIFRPFWCKHFLIPSNSTWNSASDGPKIIPKAQLKSQLKGQRV